MHARPEVTVGEELGSSAASASGPPRQHSVSGASRRAVKARCRYAQCLAEATITVRDNPQGNRYELVLDDTVVGEIVYRLQPGAVVRLHTEVSDELEGQGLGAQLVAGALDDIRARGLQIVPLCPFVSSYLRRHPEYADLVR